MSKQGIIYVGFNTDFEDYSHNGSTITDLEGFVYTSMEANKSIVFIKYATDDCKSVIEFQPTARDIEEDKVYPFMVNGRDKLLHISELKNYVR